MSHDKNERISVCNVGHLDISPCSRRNTAFATKYRAKYHSYAIIILPRVTKNAIVLWSFQRIIYPRDVGLLAMWSTLFQMINDKAYH